jgi:hypothetical protein
MSFTFDRRARPSPRPSPLASLRSPGASRGSEAAVVRAPPSDLAADPDPPLDPRRPLLRRELGPELSGAASSRWDAADCGSGATSTPSSPDERAAARSPDPAPPRPRPPRRLRRRLDPGVTGAPFSEAAGLSAGVSPAASGSLTAGGSLAVGRSLGPADARSPEVAALVSPVAPRPPPDPRPPRPRPPRERGRAPAFGPESSSCLEPSACSGEGSSGTTACFRGAARRGSAPVSLRRAAFGAAVGRGAPRLKAAMRSSTSGAFGDAVSV